MSSTEKSSNVLESGLFKELNKLGRQRNSSATPNLVKVNPVSSPSHIPPVPVSVVAQQTSTGRSMSTPVAPEHGVQPFIESTATVTAERDMSDKKRASIDHVGGLSSPAHSDGTTAHQVSSPSTKSFVTFVVIK